MRQAGISSQYSIYMQRWGILMILKWKYRKMVCSIGFYHSNWNSINVPNDFLTPLVHFRYKNQYFTTRYKSRLNISVIKINRSVWYSNLIIEIKNLLSDYLPGYMQYKEEDYLFYWNRFLEWNENYIEAFYFFCLFPIEYLFAEFLKFQIFGSNFGSLCG